MEEKDLIIEALLAQIVLLTERIAELERSRGINSTNSSKPPSSDGLKKSKRTASLRESTKEKGGQKGHIGKTLMQIQVPDVIETHHVTTCPLCNLDLSNIAVEKEIKRQIFDIKITRVVTEHKADVKICTCGKKTTASFPDSVKAPTQIGKTLKSIALYLSGNFIPVDRLSEVMEDLFNTPISDTTLLKYEGQLAENLTPFYNQTLTHLKTEDVKHSDETGIRVSGKTQWMHVLSNSMVTYLWHNPKRKSLLEGLFGIVVHDHYAPYRQLENVQHAYCNAHHLRELIALKDIEKEPWAKDMHDLLRLMCHSKNTGTLTPEKIHAFESQYDEIIRAGVKFHDSLGPLKLTKTRGRIKRRTGHNLVLRLQDYKVDTLRFLHDPGIPFTNNQAERDLRMVKVKQKVSGCFRTVDGVENFSIIRSFVSTVRKNGLNVLTQLQSGLEKQLNLSDVLANA